MRQAVGFFVLTGALIGWFQLEAPAGLNTEVNSVPELATQPSPLADNDEKNGSPKVVPDAKQMPEPRNEPKRREKWAVVQIYDARADVEAAAAILSTHEVSPLILQDNVLSKLSTTSLQSYTEEVYAQLLLRSVRRCENSECSGM